MDKFWKLITENKVVAVILAAILLFIVFYFLFRFPKRAEGSQLKLGDIPDEGSTEGNAQDIAALATQLAEQLYNEMNGPNLTRDITPFDNLMNSSDVLFEATYRAFGLRKGTYDFGAASSLKSWLNNEFAGNYGFVQSDFSHTVESLLDRMEKLTLN